MNEEEQIKKYTQTDYGCKLKSELGKLVNRGLITLKQSEFIIKVKSMEYYNYCIEKNHVWNSVTYYLKNFPDLFSIHELLLIKEPVKKVFYIINSNADSEFKKILDYQKLEYERNHRELQDGGQVSIYIVYFKQPEEYSIDDDPTRKAWLMAEDSGMRIGFHTYSDPKDSKGHIRLGLYRSFPLHSDRNDDFSKGAGGFRTDLEQGFKSSWEANIARLLNEKGFEWEYEPKSSIYSTNKEFYIPDFYVKKENKNYIVEVKGFWDNKSVSKVAYNLEKFKDNFIIIDNDFYSLINEKYKHSIPFWEHTEGSSLTWDVPVVGLFVGNRPKVVSQLNEGEQLLLIPEPHNPYDSNALKIVTVDNKDVGYIARDWASIFSYKINCGFSYNAYLLKKELSKKIIRVKLTTQSSPTSPINKIPFM